jgi:uncharacterized protein with GYD domain
MTVVYSLINMEKESKFEDLWRNNDVLFITLAKLRGAIDEEFSKKTEQFMKNPPEGVKIHNVFYALGRYDIIILYEAPSEKEALKAGVFFIDKAATETLVAIPLEEARKTLKK